MKFKTDYRPYASWQTSTLAYEIDALKKWIVKLDVAANSKHRAARKIRIELERMQYEMKRRTH